IGVCLVRRPASSVTPPQSPFQTAVTRAAILIAIVRHKPVAGPVQRCCQLCPRLCDTAPLSPLLRRQRCVGSALSFRLGEEVTESRFRNHCLQPDVVSEHGNCSLPRECPAPCSKTEDFT